MSDRAQRIVRAFKAVSALSRPSAKGRPALEALSDAWDHLDDRFHRRVPWFVEDVAMMGYEELSDTPQYERAADKMRRGLERFEKQTRSWRAALNLMLEGRDINVDRMISDIERTLKNLGTTAKNLKGLGKIKSTHPEVWDEIGRDFDKAESATAEAIKNFEKAVKLLKGGKY